MEHLALAAAALAAFLLARRLCGDGAAALAAAPVYACAPRVRALAGADPRLAAGLALWPLLLILFYRLAAVPVDDVDARRRAIAACGACLALLGALDPRLAVAGGTLCWLLLLGGWWAGRRHRGVWLGAFAAWGWACLAGVLVYAPLWLWRRDRPGAPFGSLADLSYAGADFAELWLSSGRYVGAAAVLLAIPAVLLSRSYRGPARLWAFCAGFLLWAGLGAGFVVGGRALWWVPALYRGLRRLPFLGDVPPGVLGAAGQLALAVAAAYGLLSLLARAPLGWARRPRWALGAGAAALAAWDLVYNTSP